MALDEPPMRLANDAATADSLRLLLARARADLPESAQISSLAARIDAVIASGLEGPSVEMTPDATTARLVSGKVAGILTGIVVGAIVGAGLWLGTRHYASPKSALESQSTAALQPVSLPAAPTPSPQPPIATAANTIPQAASSDGPRAANSATAPVRTTTRSPARTLPAPSETSLLREARTKLTSDPAAALRLTREHARRFPDGALSQEREVIAIEALRRLGQSETATKRGTAFEQMYPDSAHRSKVEQTLKGK